MNNAGVVHRDVKAENVMLAQRLQLDAPLPDVKLIDFGLAKPYILPDGSHVPGIPEKNTTKFEGNSMFASPKNSQCYELYHTLPRLAGARDDLI